MNVEHAMRLAHTLGVIGPVSTYQSAAIALADEVVRLRAELLEANAEQERLENQLDSVRSELVATCTRIEAWEDVLGDCIPHLDEHMRP